MALMLYLAGYVFLIFSLAGVLGCLLSSFRGATQPYMVIVSGLHARVRWLLIYLLLSLAGLPPFFFFGCKLGLLGLVLSRGAHLSSVVLGGLVLLSWAVYFSAARRLASSLIIPVTSHLRQTRLSPTAAWGCFILGGVLCVGLIMFEDACL